MLINLQKSPRVVSKIFIAFELCLFKSLPPFSRCFSCVLIHQYPFGFICPLPNLDSIRNYLNRIFARTLEMLSPKLWLDCQSSDLGNPYLFFYLFQSSVVSLLLGWGLGLGCGADITATPWEQPNLPSPQPWLTFSSASQLPLENSSRVVSVSSSAVAWLLSVPTGVTSALLFHKTYWLTGCFTKLQQALWVSVRISSCLLVSVVSRRE